MTLRFHCLFVKQILFPDPVKVLRTMQKTFKGRHSTRRWNIELHFQTPFDFVLNPLYWKRINTDPVPQTVGQGEVSPDVSHTCIHLFGFIWSGFYRGRFCGMSRHTPVLPIRPNLRPIPRSRPDRTEDSFVLFMDSDNTNTRLSSMTRERILWNLSESPRKEQETRSV